MFPSMNSVCLKESLTFRCCKVFLIRGSKYDLKGPFFTHFILKTKLAAQYQSAWFVVGYRLPKATPEAAPVRQKWWPTPDSVIRR